MPAINLEPYTAAHLEAVISLVNADAAMTMGLRRAVVDGGGALRLSHFVPAASERVVATTTQGDVVGFAYFTDHERRIVFKVGGAVHPRAWGTGIGRRLVTWAEGRAATLATQAPPDVRVVLQALCFEAELRAIRLLTGRGFARMRTWLHFEMKLSTPPPPPTLRPGLTLREMDLDDDWELVGPAMDEAFADHWGALPPLITEAPPDEPPASDEPATPDASSTVSIDSSYSNAPGACFVVMDGAEVVGGILCNTRLVERDDSGRIGSIFVRPAYRRNQIGRALMLAAFQALWERGLRRIILDTDEASFTEAPRFYQALGMRPYRREFLFEKEVRAGREIRRLSNEPHHTGVPRPGRDNAVHRRI